MINDNDKQILRELAKKQLEIANSPKNLERVEFWKEHRRYKRTRPMVHIEIDTFEQEIIAPMLKCRGDQARKIERNLYHSFTNMELFDDDKVVAPYYAVPFINSFHLFGHEISKTTATDSSGQSVGHHFNHVVGDLKNDWDKLGETIMDVDVQGTIKLRDDLSEILGDILPVTITTDCLYAVPTQLIVHIMGMENMYFAMIDYPELFTEMMDRVANDYIKYFKLMEEKGALLPTIGFQSLGQGTFCFTEELPAEGVLTTNQVWGYLDSQETVSVSPDMFERFIFPCYKKIALNYGLLSYGCCEPVDPIWKYISSLENLRNVSVSPWCNEEFMGEQLRGKNIVYHRKPSPNFLGVDKVMDESAITSHITKTLKAARGCTLEITQRDVYTVFGDIKRVQRYVQLIREAIENSW